MVKKARKHIGALCNPAKMGVNALKKLLSEQVTSRSLLLNMRWLLCCSSVNKC